MQKCKFIDESNYFGFYKEEIKRFDIRFEEKNIKGKKYVSRILKRVALFLSIQSVFHCRVYPVKC